MNLMQLFASFDPSYALKTRELEENIRAKYDVARYTAESSINREHIRGGYAQNIQQARDLSAMDREHVKGGYSLEKQTRADISAMDRDRFNVAHEDMRHRATLDKQSEIEQLKAQLALKIQDKKDKSSFRMQSFKDAVDDKRLDKTIDAQKDVEIMRGQLALSIENVRGHNGVSLSKIEHGNAIELANINKQASTELVKLEHNNALARMEEELQISVTRSGFELVAQSFNGIKEADAKKRELLLTQLTNRATLRGDVFKIGINAIVAEVSAQQDQKRAIALLEKESELRRVESYWNMLTSYVMALLNSGKQQEAKGEIDRLLEQWRAV